MKSRELTLEQVMSWLSIRDVSLRMKVTRTTVLRWIQNGYLAAIKSPVDGRWLINPKDLKTFQRPEIGNPDWLGRG